METAAQMGYETHAAPETGTGTICVAVVYLKEEGVAEDRLTQMIRSVHRQAGVQRAERARSRAKVVMIRYDRTQTSPSEIVRGLDQLGYTAVLVGC